MYTELENLITSLFNVTHHKLYTLFYKIYRSNLSKLILETTVAHGAAPRCHKTKLPLALLMFLVFIWIFVPKYEPIITLKHYEMLLFLSQIVPFRIYWKGDY